MFTEAFHSIVAAALPMLIIFIVVIASVRLSYLKSNGKKLVIHEEIFNLLFIIYVLLLFELLTGTENSLGSGINYIPFKEIMRYKFMSKMFIYNVLGNVLIFVPFGYFISRYIKPKKITPIAIDAIITSVTVETVQLKIGRSFDIDDVILNLVGAIVGYFVYVAIEAIIRHLPKFLQKDFIYDIISIIILIIFILYAANILDLGWL